MFKKLKGFTLVEALVIMTVLAILLAATTRLVTRKVVGPPEKNMHGRYEAYYKNSNEACYAYFNGSGKIVKEGCSTGPKDNLGRVTLTFDPPQTAENFHIQAVGGGGAGGSAGGSGTDDGSNSGKAKVPMGTPTYDFNYGKLATTIDTKSPTPFSEYFDLRMYNEKNTEVSDGGTPPRARNGSNSRNPKDSVNSGESHPNANRFKVGILENKDFYETFPAPTKWPRVLGSAKTQPDLAEVPNWFDWKAIKEGKVGGTANKIGEFEVVATACSSAGGDAGDFVWTTQDDYAALRDTYTKFGSTICHTNGTCCVGCCGEHCSCCSRPTRYNPSSRSCSTSAPYYQCQGSTQYTSSGACGSCPSFSDPKDKITWAPRQAVDFTGTIKGQEAHGTHGDGTYKPSKMERNYVIDPAKWDCAMLTSVIEKGTKASVALENGAITTHDFGTGKHQMAENYIKRPKGANVKHSGADHTQSNIQLCGPYGTHGVTGTATINDKSAKAIGGEPGVGYCPAKGNEICRKWIDEDGNEQIIYKCKYNFVGSYYDSSSYHYIQYPTGQVLASTPFPFDGSDPFFKSPARDGYLPDASKNCKTINGRNYCRTGLYNHEYSYEMARGYKQLAYGDRGQTGKFETKTVGQINQPIKIILGKGGEWEPNGKHNGRWNTDSGSHGPSGSDTIVGNLLTVAGGAGGKGALKTDKYELCSIFDKGKKDDKGKSVCEFDDLNSLNSKYNINKYYRIQPGTAGESSIIETTAKNSRLANKTPGKGGNGVGTISTREFVCEARAVYNLMVTNNSPYNSAFKYNGYTIVQAFKQAKIDPPDVLCATTGANGVGNEYFYEPDANKNKGTKPYRQGAEVKKYLKEELKGDDAAVIITW